eukprot:m.108596 g.108596  ORF g.108596 m.108596 type:complete len:68 (+) comp9009_c0_seq1:27-230(+)
MSSNLLPLRIATYNVLAQCYAKKSFFPYALLRVLEFTFRLPNIMREVHAMDADVLCLQVVCVLFAHH